MCNPFLEIPLDVYEKHTSLEIVKQLQVLNQTMKKQLTGYAVCYIIRLLKFIIS